MSPEVKEGKTATTASDMFSFGMIILFLHFPQYERKSSDKIEVPDHENKDLVSLLQGLLNLNDKESKKRQNKEVFFTFFFFRF